MTKRWTRVRQVHAWARTSHERALANARSAATEASRGRVQREEVEIFLRAHAERAQPATVPARATTRPA